MKKRYVFSAIGAVGAGVAGYVLKDKDNRNKLKEKVKFATQKMKEFNHNSTTLEDAGIPDQTDNKDLAQFENAKMVSEGSQFGVNYYNEVKAKSNS
ncbi:hypothetical protein [Virgibacillus oceani]|uniref:YtxH domain-containing protein n=1 Tax=Virgibacillus oceani TaxID=1479511 RepID=A0A917H815_9BACI|nr:hypothetical protein [Virgibacillus oceani]GGG70090.1 hypothetical protein GCM10011398_12660 [Virgibacillus oceani]